MCDLFYQSLEWISPKEYNRRFQGSDCGEHLYIIQQKITRENIKKHMKPVKFNVDWSQKLSLAGYQMPHTIDSWVKISTIIQISRFTTGKLCKVVLNFLKEHLHFSCYKSALFLIGYSG